MSAQLRPPPTHTHSHILHGAQAPSPDARPLRGGGTSPSPPSCRACPHVHPRLTCEHLQASVGLGFAPLSSASPVKRFSRENGLCPEINAPSGKSNGRRRFLLWNSRFPTTPAFRVRGTCVCAPSVRVHDAAWTRDRGAGGHRAEVIESQEPPESWAHARSHPCTPRLRGLCQRPRILASSESRGDQPWHPLSLPGSGAMPCSPKLIASPVSPRGADDITLSFRLGCRELTYIPSALQPGRRSKHPSSLTLRTAGPGSRFSRSSGARPAARWRSRRQLLGTACRSPRGRARCGRHWRPASCVCRTPRRAQRVGGMG